MPPGGRQLGAWFDHASASAACAFFPRFLRFTEGEWAGQPFELQPWQRDRVIRPLFGWKRADKTRLIRTVYLEVAKKNGKSELAGGIGIIMLCADNEYGAQVYCTAIDKDQAKITFNKSCRMVGLSEPLKGVLEVYKTAIFCPELMASFKPLSSNIATKYGFNPSCNLADETHAWRDGTLFQVVHDGFAGRRQPLEVLMTTAGEYHYGWGWEQHEYALKVRDGLIEDPSFLPVIFAAEEDDDWTDEKVWAKANPNLGVSVKVDFLKGQVAKAKHNETLEGNFKRFHLDLWTSIGAKPISVKDWRACTGDLDVDALAKSLEGRDCYGGLDLASLYYAQGRYAEAEPLLKRALAIKEKVLGSEHPSVATSLNGVAVLYQAKGRCAEAEPLYRRALAIWEKALDPEHPNVAKALLNYAVLLRATGRSDERERMETRAKAIRAKYTR